MGTLIHWCGFVGAWLLVSGSVHQARLELDTERIHAEHIRRAVEDLPPSPRVSQWWWLLPPVALWLMRRNHNAYTRDVFATLAPDDLAVLNHLFDVARGWLFVAGGAGLVAVKETYELTDHARWPIFAFWLLIVGGMVAVFALTSAIRRRTA